MAGEDPTSDPVAHRDSLETTPLLFDQPNETDLTNPSPIEPRTEARHRAPRNIRSLTWLSLGFSIITLAFAITISIIHYYDHFGYYPRRLTLEAQKLVLGLAIFATVFSIFNCICLHVHGHTLPLLLNLVLDLVICIWAIAAGVRGLTGNFTEDTCYYSSCVWILVLVGLTFGFALALGIVHVVLFLISCVSLCRTKFWRQPWHSSTRQITFELTFRIRQQWEYGKIDQASIYGSATEKMDVSFQS